MANGFQRLKGSVFLGYRAILAHPLKRLFAQSELSPKQRFLANYAPEGNVVTTLEDRAILAGASRCIHCGLCDAYDSLRVSLPPALYRGPSLLPVAYARANPDLPALRPLLQRLDPSQFARAESVCPTGVPLSSIARYLQRKLEELDAARTLRP